LNAPVQGEVGEWVGANTPDCQVPVAEVRSPGYVSAMRRCARGFVYRVCGPALAVVAAAGASACGSDTTSYTNAPRPPSPINVTAAITDQRIEVSPRRFGAGPIVLIISNQSSDAQAVTFETDGADAGIRQTTSAINPAGTAQLQIDVDQGRYRLSVGDHTIRPASVRVGKPRESAQNALLQP
jgi:hypothetical protein